MSDRELIKRLREHFGLSKHQADDDMILKVTEGTFLREIIELHIAVGELLREIKKVLYIP